MKKKFKTIMALTAALVISMSGMCMTIADEDTTPPPPTTQSVAVEDKNSDGKFDAIDPIPVTMGTEHLLSFTIDFGDMAMSYDFTDTSADNNYGWGDSFDGENNKLTITNNSTCHVNAYIKLDIDEKTYPCLEKPNFSFNDENVNNQHTGTPYYAENIIPLSYDGDQTEGAITSFDTYLNVVNSSKLTDMHNYQFNNAKIGEITITLTPVFGTIPTETGYYVKVTEVSDFDQLFEDFGFEAISICGALYSGVPCYFGPYTTTRDVYEVKALWEYEGATCSVVYIP